MVGVLGSLLFCLGAVVGGSVGEMVDDKESEEENDEEDEEEEKRVEEGVVTDGRIEDDVGTIEEEELRRREVEEDGRGMIGENEEEVAGREGDGLGDGLCDTAGLDEMGTVDVGRKTCDAMPLENN